MTDQQVNDVRSLTRAAGIKPTTTKVSGPEHALLRKLAPGDRVLVAGGQPDERPAQSGNSGGGGGGRRSGGGGGRPQGGGGGQGGRSSGRRGGSSSTSTAYSTSSSGSTSGSHSAAGFSGRRGSR
jgi:hypothetical protein